MPKPVFDSAASIGTRLKETRLWRGLTIIDLHKKAKVAVGTISDAENDIRKPNVSTLLKLAEALEVSLKTLTGA